MVLLSDRVEALGRHRLQMGLVAETWNWQELDDWPILFTNLVRWRRHSPAGRDAAERPAGSDGRRPFAPGSQAGGTSASGGPAAGSGRRGRLVNVVADHVGLYTVRAGESPYRFSCNAVSRRIGLPRRGQRPLGQLERLGRAPGPAAEPPLGVWIIGLATLGGHLAAVAADFRRGQIGIRD